MIIFGQTQDILIRTHKNPKHFGVKKFIPVMQREGECYTREKGFHIGKRYKEEFWWTSAARSKFKMSWVVFRLQIKHRGQKDFFQNLLEKK